MMPHTRASLTRALNPLGMILLSLWLAIAPVYAGSLGLLVGGGGAAAAPTYTGPGDAVSGAVAFGSCARALNAAYANGTNPLCDLVDSAAPTVVICTLQVKTTGFVDLTGTYCTGTVTPATKCAAATGGVCNVSKVYDQTGNGHAWTNATAASQPKLTFSALNGLPGMSGTNAAATQLVSNSITQVAPYSEVAVFERTGSVTSLGGIYTANGNGLWGNSVANSVMYRTSAGNTQVVAATDSAFHAMQANQNGASSNTNVDGTTTSGSLSNNNISAVSFIFFPTGLASLTGIIMEVGLWGNAISAPTMNTNQHSATNGYNF